MARKKVFVQVKNQSTGCWTNYKGFNTYDEACEKMKELHEKYPEAILRVLDNNLETHTNVK